jgi:hypothetical protein
VTNRLRAGPLSSFTIAALEIWGGAAGLYAVFLVLAPGPSGFVRTGVVAVAGLFYLTSLLAGITFLQRRDVGRRLSIVVQVLQLVTFKIGSLGYLLYSGAALFVGFAGVEITFDLELASGFHVSLGATDHLSIALNLLPIAALALLTHKEVVTRPVKP